MAGMKCHNIFLGRSIESGDYEGFPGEENVAAYARSGSGKTADLAIPNAFLWGGSLVCLDVKGTIFRATAGYRSEVLNQQIVVLNPAARDFRTHRWNPLAAIDRESIDRFDQIRRLSYSLWPDASAYSSASSNSDRFWEPSGRSAFEGVLELLAETPDKAMTTTEILRMFTSADANEQLAKMIEERRAKKDFYSQIAVDQVVDYIRGHHEQVEGFRKTVTTKLAPWFAPRLMAAMECNDFDLRMIRRKPMSIYITIPPAAIPRYRSYITLFFEQLLALNSDVLPDEDDTIQHQVLLLLDEFIRPGRIVELAEAGQYLREYGFRILFIIQDKPQLAAKYGEDAMADIFSNVGAECVFGVSDLKTTRELSERIGYNTVPIDSESRPRWWGSWQWNRQTVSTGPRQRAHALPQEIARLSPDEMVVLRAGMMPSRYKRVRWFKDENFKKLYRPPPEIPPIEVTIPLDDGKTAVRMEAPKKKKKAAKKLGNGMSKLIRQRTGAANGSDPQPPSHLDEGPDPDLDDLNDPF
jgi:type IV secretion system protein VirD4